MYNGGNSNENFRWIPEKDCNRGGLDGYVSQVTSVAFGDATNCPFSHVALDNKYWNHNVGEIQYSNGYCTATDSLARVVLGQCEEGGTTANGVVMVEASCGSNYAIDRYWSDNGAIPGTEYTLTSGGNPGVQAIFSRGLNTCWGGI